MSTVYTQEPGYRIQKTVGGYVVVYIEDAHHMRPVDGGRVHQSRQNAYAKAKRLNEALKRALKPYGMAEAVYLNAYIANVQDEQGEFGDQFSLSLRKGDMSPFETKFFNSLDELEQYTREVLPHPLLWYKVKPEEI